MTDLELALEKHKYVVEPGGKPQVNITAIAKLIDDGKSSAFAGAAVKITKAGGDYRSEWKESGEQGTRVHGYFENFLLNKPINYRPGEEGFVKALVGFIEAEDPQLIIDPEFVVVSPHGYGGRGDLCARLVTRGRGIWDLKSGKRYAVEHTLQLALQRFAELAVYDDAGMFVGTKPMPEVEVTGCFYANQDGTYDSERDLVEYPADEAAFEAAMNLLGAYNWTRTAEITKLRNAWRSK